MAYVVCPPPIELQAIGVMYVQTGCVVSSRALIFRQAIRSDEEPSTSVYPNDTLYLCFKGYYRLKLPFFLVGIGTNIFG